MVLSFSVQGTLERSTGTGTGTGTLCCKKKLDVRIFTKLYSTTVYTRTGTRLLLLDWASSKSYYWEYPVVVHSHRCRCTLSTTTTQNGHHHQCWEMPSRFSICLIFLPCAMWCTIALNFTVFSFGCFVATFTVTKKNIGPSFQITNAHHSFA